MAIGIVAHGVYVPWHRLGLESRGWTGRGERSVANFDEDSITMAVAAANNCLSDLDQKEIGALYFASSTSPYKEKSAATLVAAAADLKPSITTADFSSSLRAGTTALKAAVDAVKAGSEKRVLITTGEVRYGKLGSKFDATLGDGAAAFLIGDSRVIAEIEDFYSISQEVYDTWRTNEDSYLQTWEDRWTVEEGYFKVLPEVVSQLMVRSNLTPKDFTKLVLYAPNARRHTEMARRIGFDPAEQVQDPLFGSLGNTGSAFALMILSAALEEARGGDRILLANCGNGADGLVLKVTDEIEKIRARRGMKRYLQSKKIIDDYQAYIRWRGLADYTPGARRPAPSMPSPSALLREVSRNIRFYGSKCKRCGYSQYPPQRVCTRCHTRDEYEDYPFADKKATVFTYAMDYLTPNLDPPLVITVADFAGGGRALLETTDRDMNQYKIGSPLEMSFRKLYTTGSIANYFWKCMPVRE